MKKILLLLVLLSSSIGLKAGDGKWKVIKNKLYSIEFPSDWVPQPGMPGNGFEPGKREVGPYIIYYFAWYTPVKSREDIPKCIGIDIQTYEKKDGAAIPLDEAQKLTIRPLNRIEEKMYSSSDELRYTATQTSKEMDGSFVKYRIFFLLKKKNNRAYCIRLDLREELYKKNTNLKEVLLHILNSFSIN